MPVLKIAKPQPLDPKIGLPWHASSHMLTLCEQHLSEKTDAMLSIFSDEIYDLTGGGVIVYDNKVIDFRVMDNNGSIGRLPKDLQDCIVFAAKHGYNMIQFDRFDPQDCPLIEHLRVYPRPWNPNPPVNSLLFPPPETQK